MFSPKHSSDCSSSEKDESDEPNVPLNPQILLDLPNDMNTDQVENADDLEMDEFEEQDAASFTQH